MKPMMTPTAVELRVRAHASMTWGPYGSSGALENLLPPIMAPIFTVAPGLVSTVPDQAT